MRHSPVTLVVEQSIWALGCHSFIENHSLGIFGERIHHIGTVPRTPDGMARSCKLIMEYAELHDFDGFATVANISRQPRLRDELEYRENDT